MLIATQNQKFKLSPPFLFAKSNIAQVIKAILLNENLNTTLGTAKSLDNFIPFLSCLKFSSLQKLLLDYVATIPDINNPSSPDFQRIILLFTETLLAQNLFTQSYQILNLLEQHLKSLTLNGNLQRYMLNMAICLRGVGFTSTSVQYLNQLLQYFENKGARSGSDKIEVLYQLAMTYKHQGKLENSVESLQKALELCKDQNQNTYRVGVIERELGNIYCMQGKLLDALDYLQASLEKLETSLSRENPEVGKVLVHLGEVYVELGREEEGFEHCQEGAIYLRKSYEEGSPFIAESYYVLGKAFKATRKLELANEYLLKSLTMVKEFYKGTHIDYSMLLKIKLELADLRREESKIDQALTFSNECACILKAWLGSQSQVHSLCIEIFEVMGRINEQDYRLTEAIQDYEKGLEIAIKLGNHGQYHEAILRMRIGQTYLKLPSVKKALDNFEKGIRILKKELGEENYLVADGYLLQAQAYEALGRIHQAQQLYIKGAMLNKKIYGKENHRLWRFHYLIGVTYVIQGKLRSAVGSLTKAIKLVKNFYGNKSQELPRIYFKLGDVFLEQRKNIQALENYKNGLDASQAVGDGSYERYEYIGKVLLFEEKSEEAIINFQKALKIKSNLLGEKHPSLSEEYLNIAKGYMHLEKYDESLGSLRNGQKLIEERCGKEHVSLHIFHQLVGKVYMKKLMNKEAVESYHQGLAILKKAFGNGNSLMGEIYRDLATIYQSQGNMELALSYLKMATDLQQTAWNREYFKVFMSRFSLGCLYGNMGQYELGIKHLEGAKFSLEKAKCQSEVKEERIEKRISLLKKNLLLSRSLDC